MSKITIAIIVAAVAFFIIGMVAGNFHCGAHFCNTVTELVNLVTDLVKTEVKGITTVVGGISNALS
jgi:hypothetical protein